MDENLDMNELHDDPQQLFNQLDHRGFNLLMIAAENGRDDEVTRLLALGFDVNSSIGPHTAASLAYQHRHFDSLLILLNANSKFPPDFNAEATQHAELITFTKLMNQFHDHLFGEEARELQNIITEHPQLRYFYNIDGHSAAFESLNNMIINCYELFVQNNILMSPDEDFSEAIVSLTDDQKEQIRVIHERYAVPLPNNHLMIIHGSLFVIHDETEINRLNIAQNAINFLNDIPQIQPTLKLIARAGCFKIIFDFNRENTQFMNPKSSRDTRGLFCTTRHIYIAARNLLNEVNRMEVYGTMAHELTHFAMNLVYSNNCKPYKEADRDTIGQEFHQILLQSRQQNIIEDIINAVWNYPEENQFAELIVRVPHMMAFYANNQVILNLRIMQFQTLFNFYTTRVLPDIINKIPTINAEVNQMRADFYDKTIKKVSKWRKMAKILFGLVPLGIIIAALLTFSIVFKPDIQFNELSPEEQDKVFNGNVKFLNLTLKFHELYNQNNTQLLDSLDSIQLRTLIDGETLDLSDKLNVHLQDQIILVYSNMTESLRAKLKDGKVNFQGAQSKLKQITGVNDNSKIFEVLNAEQVRKLITDELVVGNAQEIKAKFYIERDFIDFDIETEKDFRGNWFEEVLNKTINFDEISSIADVTKMILLSDHAGAGKTTTFKHLSVKLKEKFPHFWISYIDLKRHLKVYEKFDRNFQVLKVLQEILSITDQLEIEIFTKLFDSNRVILLYDGVDEIAPKFKDFFIRLIESVRNSTKNQQWIATRPQHIEELGEKFNQKAYKLMPYDEDKKNELIGKILKSLKVENINAGDVSRDIDIITDEVSINSPLMLEMMIEIYAKDKTVLVDFNIFSLYDKMIDMKKDIVTEKGEIVNRDRDNRKADLSIWKVHQIFALKLLYKDGFRDCFNGNKTIDINEFQLLKRWKKEKSKWTPEAISRYGFLYVDDWNADDEFPDFVHRTFAEYFVAQFLIQDLYELDVIDDDDDEMSEKEIELRFKLFNQILIDKHDIENFISSYIDFLKLKKMNKNFFKLMTSNGNVTIFQHYFINETNLNYIIQIFDIYKGFLGTDWIHYIGYSLKENFLMQNYEETDEMFEQDFGLKEFFDILNLIDHLEMPQYDLLRFFGNNFDSICQQTFESLFLTQKLIEIIENNFHNCKSEFFKMIVKNEISYDFLTGYVSDIVKLFIQNLEEFLQSDKSISVDDMKDFTIGLILRYCDMKSLINSYEDKFFSKNQILQYFMKHPEEIAFFMDYYDFETSIEDFIIFFKDIFADRSDELKKFIEMRYEDDEIYNHTILSYLDEKIEIDQINSENMEMSEILKLFKATLLELAKQIGITDDEIEKFSERGEIDYDDSSSE